MATSIKQKSYKIYTVTTGSTVTIPNGIVSSVDPNVDSIKEYVIEGTTTLLANLIYTMSTPVQGTDIEIYYKAAVTPSGFTLTILDSVIPTRLLSKKFILKAVYNGTTWDNTIIVDNAETANIDGLSITDASVTDAKIIALAASKLTGTVSDAQIAAMNANKLSGSIDPARYANNTIPAAAIANSSLTAAQLADNAVTLAKIGSTGVLYVDAIGASTTAVITEETLGSYALPANIVSATGKGIRVKGAFSFATNNNVKTVRLKINGQTIYNSATAVPTDTTPNNARLLVEFDLIRTSATTGKVMGVFNMTESATSHTSVGLGTATGLDFTAIQNILFTGQNGTAAAGDIVFEVGSIEIIL
jgi:hypothetical protein